MSEVKEVPRQVLLRRGFVLEYVTLGWNVAGIVVLAAAAVAARSVALAGFGLDSLIDRRLDGGGLGVVRRWLRQGPHRCRPGQPGTEGGRPGHPDRRSACCRGAARSGPQRFGGIVVGGPPAAGYVLVYYAVREVKEIVTGEH
ncbi:hypothetical protein [Actinacidiphila paucisporea]|uniref:hypothetical protein n=1 Tax=Actinacidiphila paucisporea TaxID=310782 RepID=UPI001F18EB87|nr:hypothetical protein [Actinacidiphila paucisporea]